MPSERPDATPGADHSAQGERERRHKSHEGRSLDSLPSALLTVQQVAAFLGVSTRTVRRLIRGGELVAHRIARTVRVDAQSVTHLLETTRVVASFGTSPCSEGQENATPKEFRISSDSAVPGKPGQLSSMAARSRSARPTRLRPSDGSSNSATSAAELRERVRARRQSR